MTGISQCIHCGRCTQSCGFLNKYGLDLAGFTQKPELAYHCLLCGTCTRVCPMGIDGKALALTLRRQQVQEGCSLKEYRLLRAEKEDYLFKNYKNGGKKTVFFPGCNFAGYYPKTTDTLCRILKEKLDWGVVFDCCGRPVSDLGLTGSDAVMTRALEQRLSALGVEEVVTACPNCYDHLHTRLSIPVRGIYEKLAEAEVFPKAVLSLEGKIFVPCPDREEGRWLADIQYFFKAPLKEHLIEGVQCCGLGGCAFGKDPEVSAELKNKVQEQVKGDLLYSYCASCCGRLAGPAPAMHILALLTGTMEKPDTKKGWLNRAARKL